MSISLSKTNLLSLTVRKKTLSKRIELGAASLIIITIIMICTLSLAYLAHSNKIATRAYQLKSLEKQRNDLITENELWNIKLTDALALENIEKNPQVASMISLQNPIFIRGDTAVAKDNSTPSIN